MSQSIKELEGEYGSPRPVGVGGLMTKTYKVVNSAAETTTAIPTPFNSIESAVFSFDGAAGFTGGLASTTSTPNGLTANLAHTAGADFTVYITGVGM